MKRSKRTDKIGDQDLSPLTEKILAKMGSEGAAIRRRLQVFYQTRAEPGEGGVEETYAAWKAGTKVSRYFVKVWVQEHSSIDFGPTVNEAN